MRTSAAEATPTDAVATVTEDFEALRAQVVELFNDAQVPLVVVGSGPVPNRPTGAPPPPPPPPPPPASHGGELWAGLEAALHPVAPSHDDPIQAFAPPPHMDWGPRKQGRLARRLRRSE